MNGFASIVTTCKGRLHHLKETLPRMLAQQALEVIVVDYDCPDGTGDWVEANHPGVRVVRATDPLGFSLARARNVGAAEARGEWLAFVDADTILEPGWLGWIAKRLAERRYFVVEKAKGNRDCAGSLVCGRAMFRVAGRYDETIRGWGGEDVDFRGRLKAVGCRPKTFPAGLMRSIDHGDEERSTTEGLTFTQVMMRSRLRRRAKELVNAAFGGLDPCCRDAMNKALGEAVRHSNSRDQKEYLPVSFHRYCPTCAERLSNNAELVMDRRGLGLLWPTKYVLTAAGRPVAVSRGKSLLFRG